VSRYNFTEAVDSVAKTVSVIRAKTQDGDVYNALWILDALRQELCNETIDSALLDPLLSELMDQMDSVSDASELLDGLDYVMRMSNYASPNMIGRAMNLIMRAKAAMGMAVSPQASPRKKRDTSAVPQPFATAANEPTLTTSMSMAPTRTINEASASTLLNA